MKACFIIINLMVCVLLLYISSLYIGPGSFYQKDKSGSYIASHATWQLGRKVKDTPTPFEPNVAVDLPDESMNVCFVTFCVVTTLGKLLGYFYG